MDQKMIEALAETLLRQQGVTLTPGQAMHLAEVVDQFLLSQMVPGRHWLVTDPDGVVWAETTDEAEARECVEPGFALARMHHMHLSAWVEQFVTEAI